MPENFAKKANGRASSSGKRAAEFGTANPSSSKKVKNFDPRKISYLVVDDDPQCLHTVMGMLKQFHDSVHGCTSGIEALEILRTSGIQIDIVLVDIIMPGELDGFKLSEIIGLELCIPVVLMSVEGTDSNVLKGVTHGAVNFISKPVRLQDLRFLWQHAFSKLINEERQKYEKKKAKKPRMIWTPELHQRFMDAVNQLGIDKAVPKKIKEIMGIKFLNREQIASHLQKYRHFLKQTPNILMPQLEAPASVTPSLEMLHQPNNTSAGLSSEEVSKFSAPTLSLPVPTPILHRIPGQQEHLFGNCLPDFVPRPGMLVQNGVNGVNGINGVFDNPQFSSDMVQDQDHSFFHFNLTQNQGRGGDFKSEE
eukprot:CAMPEP_0197475884 /NCGR_PEP_ID=MMETSP1309-20131121/7256_1 /TAXON_ID=464262 /ORGANISM="Genus nov. species nov., Strain RCC998" /LENGTH=364 /DNA_ID=CAMNT_0043016017 /DNA_START=530 /DNA_END=1624 /DNA_ORIENTATION=+